MINKKLFEHTIKEKEKKYKDLYSDNREEWYFLKLTEQDSILLQHFLKDDTIFIWHKYCVGKVFFENFKKYNILYCKNCNLRVEFPQYIKEFKEFKKYFENKFKEKIKKVTRAELIDLED